MNKIDRKLLGLIILLILSFFVFASTVIFRDRLGVLTRAAADTTPSASDSKIFAWPLDLAVGQASAVTVFVVSTNGHKVSGKNVHLNTTTGSVQPTDVVSGEAGEARFTLQSDTPGKAVITAVVDNNATLTQALSVVFR